MAVRKLENRIRKMKQRVKKYENSNPQMAKNVEGQIASLKGRKN